MLRAYLIQIVLGSLGVTGAIVAGAYLFFKTRREFSAPWIKASILNFLTLSFAVCFVLSIFLIRVWWNIPDLFTGKTGFFYTWWSEITVFAVSVSIGVLFSGSTLYLVNLLFGKRDPRPVSLRHQQITPRKTAPDSGKSIRIAFSSALLAGVVLGGVIFSSRYLVRRPRFEMATRATSSMTLVSTEESISTAPVTPTEESENYPPHSAISISKLKARLSIAEKAAHSISSHYVRKN